MVGPLVLNLNKMIVIHRMNPNRMALQYYGNYVLMESTSNNNVAKLVLETGVYNLK